MDDFVHFMRSVWGLWLMGIFVGVVAWAYWPRNKKAFEKHAMIPLDDDAPLASTAAGKKQGGADHV